MDFSIVLIGTGILCAVAVVLGLAISIVTQIFHIEVDPRVEQIYEVLPNFNCGACGCPGCMPYAEGIVNDHLEITKCKPGKEAVAQKIKAILEQ